MVPTRLIRHDGHTIGTCIFAAKALQGRSSDNIWELGSRRTALLIERVLLPLGGDGLFAEFAARGTAVGVLTLDGFASAEEAKGGSAGGLTTPFGGIFRVLEIGRFDGCHVEKQWEVKMGTASPL